MKRILPILISILTLALPLSGLAQEAQEPPELRLSRDFGYGGGLQIQGTFSFRINNPENFVRVEFLIDDQVVFTDEEEPFRYQFSTDVYEPGLHVMAARAYQADGTMLTSNLIQREFVTAEQAWESVGGIIIPVLVIVGLLTVLGFVVPLITSRKQDFKPGVYGAAGGAICPRCRFPYTRHFFAPNMVLGKLERCPHCGKWAIVAAANPAALKEAEARWASENPGTIETPSEEQKLQRMLDDSRYQD